MDAFEREKLISAYIEAYNSKDVDGMMAPLNDKVVFENFSSGEKTLAIEGKSAFRKQAQEALAYFSQRKQILESIRHLDRETEVEISYWAISAIDFPNGIKKGQELNLKGKSVFRFSNEKISSIQDYS